MKAKIILPGLALLAILSSLNMQLSNLQAQGTAFTYQGSLISGGSPASGMYDIAFLLFSSTSIDQALLAGPVTNGAVARVTNGLFTTTVDFGRNVFMGRTPGCKLPSHQCRERLQHPCPAPTGHAGALRPVCQHGQQPDWNSYGGTNKRHALAGEYRRGHHHRQMLAPDAVTMLGTPGNGPTNAVNVSSNGLVGIGTGSAHRQRDYRSPPARASTRCAVSFAVHNGQQGWTNIDGPYAAAINGNILALGGQTGLTLASITNPDSPALLTQIAAASGFHIPIFRILLPWHGPVPIWWREVIPSRHPWSGFHHRLRQSFQSRQTRRVTERHRRLDESQTM